MARESMEYDVLIVGGGRPGSRRRSVSSSSGERNHEVSVCLIEKGSEIGAHILSARVDPIG